MHKRHSLIAALVLAAYAGGAQAQTATPSWPAGPAVGTSQAAQAGGFIRDAFQTGHAEIQAAQLALERASDPAVKAFARQMITDHTQANAQLQQIALRQNIVLPSGLSIADQSRMRLLKTDMGTSFDRRYIEEFGVQAHRQSVEQFRLQLQNNQDGPMQAFARQTLPTLEQHLQRALEMHGSQQAIATPAGASGVVTAQSSVNGTSGSNGGMQVSPSEAREARAELAEAIQVVQRMKSDPSVTELLQRARGVFILPDYGRAALGIGVQGGSGVLVTRQGDGFSNPVFYNMGGISIGPQAGAAGGQIALLLMTNKAVQDFKSDKNFSLNADAGINIARYARRAQASAGKIQDVIVWSGARGAYAGASFGLNDVVFDDDANRAYYGRQDLNASAILDGRVQNPGNNVLGMVLGI
ncbi:MAG: DUF4142 domain-containing protein [Pseudomonadota bacterium]|nr:DUF4142 domain-containing protein [Pseudomonadota bacterium]